MKKFCHQDRSGSGCSDNDLNLLPDESASFFLSIVTTELLKIKNKFKFAKYFLLVLLSSDRFPISQTSSTRAPQPSSAGALCLLPH